MARPPGPRMPSFAQATMVMAEPYRWMTARQRRYGDIFKSHFPMFGEVTYLAQPDLVREMFGTDPETHRAGESNATVLEPVLGQNSLLTLDGDAHMRQRKLLLPSFHGERVRGYAELVAGIAESEVESWPHGTPYALRPAMQRITLEVILRAVFGVRGEDRLQRFRVALPRLGETSLLLLFYDPLRRDFGRWSPWAKFLRARDAVDELIYEEIRLHREDPDLEERDDVLSMLLCARDEDGQPMTDVELRDELITLLTAGHETTATGLSWAFERLVRTPSAMAAAVDSLDEGDDYLDAVAKESLRIRPVIVDVARRVKVDWQVGGYDIPEGTLVMAAIVAIHHRPDLWERPLLFRPERFLESQPVPYSWIPFGGGVRRCIGATFALMEMRVVLRTVLERVSLSAARPQSERPRAQHVTVVPARGAEVVVGARTAAGTRAAPLVTAAG